MLLRILKNVNRNRALQRKGMEIWHILANGRWEMLLKAVGQPLSTTKGYRIAAGKCPKAIGQPLGNS
jgi:predicted cupin superfamily sugar epimerase